jgi:hypothetical protein
MFASLVFVVLMTAGTFAGVHGKMQHSSFYRLQAAFMLSVSVRMFLSFVFIIVLIRFNMDAKYLLLLNFLLLYMTFLVVEVRELLRDEKK